MNKFREIAGSLGLGNLPGANAGSLSFKSGSPPSAPTANAATSITDIAFNANWGAVSGATGYWLYLYQSDGVTQISKTNVGNVTAANVGGLTQNTSYKWAVSAYNASGEGALSAQQSVITYDADAQTFFTANLAAVGTLTANNKLAINKLFLNFKGIGVVNSTSNLYSRLWPYLFAGGVANSAKINARTLATGTFGGSNLGYGNNAFNTDTNAYFETAENINVLSANAYGFLISNRVNYGAVQESILAISDGYYSIQNGTIRRHLWSGNGYINGNSKVAGVFGFNKITGSATVFNADLSLSVQADPPYTAITLNAVKIRLGLTAYGANAGQQVYDVLVFTSGLSNAEMSLLQSSIIQYNTDILL